MLKLRKLFFWNNNDINPINYGFKKGFPAPIKSGSNTRAEKKNKKQQQTKKNKKNKKGMKKKTLFFHVCSKNFRQSATDTLPAFRATSSG